MRIQKLNKLIEENDKFLQVPQIQSSDNNDSVRFVCFNST